MESQPQNPKFRNISDIREAIIICQIQYFEADFLYMESQPQNPEFRNNPENSHP